MRPPRNTLLSVLVPALATSCGGNILLDPDSRAASLPSEADVAVGATHDVFVMACQDKVSLADVLFPVAATALFVGLGRLDAAFYLPGAVVKGANPRCKEVEYSVTGAKLEKDAFELEATANDKAFKAHARREGEVKFSAKAVIGGEEFDVQSTLRAWKADRVEMALLCDRQFGGELLPTHVPAGERVGFVHKLFSGDRLLSGYGFVGIQSPQLTFEQQGDTVNAVLPSRTGPFSITSDIDPDFKLDLIAYDANDFDSLTLERQTAETIFVGAKTKVRALATIGGKLPCVPSFTRTVTISTPTVCRFLNPEGPIYRDWRNVPGELEALAPGSCSMAVTMPGTSRTASLDIPVFRGFEPHVVLPSSNAVTSPYVDFWLEGSDAFHLVGLIVGNLGAESVTLRRTAGAWGQPKILQRPEQLQSVHGASGTQAIYAVGNRGGAARWSGAEWVGYDAGTTGDLNDVWVNGVDDAYAVGDKGTFRHFGSNGWSALDAGTGVDLRSLWGDGAGNLYVAGNSGFVRRFDGASFSEVLPPGFSDAGFQAIGVVGSRPSDLWVHSSKEGLHFDGGGWTRTLFVPADAGFTTQVTRMWPVGDGYTYMLVRRAVGSSLPYATVDRFDGTRSVPIPVPLTTRAITGIGNDIYLLTANAILRYRHNPADVFP